EGQEYYGQIVSYTTQQPIPGIRVTARNLETGSTDQVTTDQNGTFRLGLQPNATYILIYSGAGYREVRRNVNTFNLTRDGLGVLSLYPSTFVDTPDNDPNPTPPQPPGPGVSQSGFSIQLGALSKRPPLSRYDNLSSLNGGDVYVKEGGGKYRVRYGVFPDRAAAQRFLSSVKNRGYRDAYIVAEDGAVIGGSSGGSTTPPTTRPNPITQPNPTTNPTNTRGNYKIQLAALRNTRWFDGSAISNLGTIEDRKRGDLTIKLLGGFQTQSAAQQALTTVKANGFPTAFIVYDNNGQLQRL
ncbi:MAG: SPOR domain-containing protein, partial [Bacteroidota bacterium]